VQGWLQKVTSGQPGISPLTLQDLRYTYDSVGNILTIKDYYAGNLDKQFNLMTI
jgi:hypothetical protein